MAINFENEGASAGQLAEQVRNNANQRGLAGWLSRKMNVGATAANATLLIGALVVIAVAVYMFVAVVFKTEEKKYPKVIPSQRAAANQPK
jgi:putative exporter of polyketide antibiotics